MNDVQPLVSVVIPTHNREDILIRAIQSVQNQSYSNIEIIVVDDASNYDIAQKLSSFNDVKLLINSENRGPCYSRNRGINESTGNYINFLDDDDIFYTEKIQKQVDKFINSKDEKLGMVTCHSSDERSGTCHTRYNRVLGDIYLDLISSYVVSGIETMLFKTSYLKEIKGYDEALESSQEYDLLIRFTEFYTVDYVDEILCKEYRSENQISTNFNKKISGTKYLYMKYDQKYRELGAYFYLKMQLKLRVLIFRYQVGKIFGEKVYRLLVRKRA